MTRHPQTEPPTTQNGCRAEIAAVVAAISRPGEPPGAVAAAGWAAAFADAVTASTAANAAPATSVLDAVDDDIEAYWGERETDRWCRETPTLVADEAQAIALRTRAAWDVNPADMQAGWALAVGASAAARAVARHNRADAHTPSTLLPGTLGDGRRLIVSAADGCRVRLADGTVLLDASSGLYNSPLGHGHPAPAVGFLDQATSAASVNPFTCSTPVAEKVASRLLALFEMPGGRAIFAASGSEAVETAIRLAAHAASGSLHARPSTFHGITAGAAALSDIPGIRGRVSNTLHDVIQRPIAEWTAPGVGVVEPSGMTTGRAPLTAVEVDQLRQFRQAGGIVVVDEVLSGLGRTLWPGLTPTLGIPADMVVLGKGLGNGLVPVSAVLVGAQVLDACRRRGPLDHGHTHSNHPASLGAAAACLDALETTRESPDRLRIAAEAAGLELRALGWLASVPVVPRGREQMTADLLDGGLLCHLPTMAARIDRLVIAPPITITPGDLDDMLRRVAAVARQENT